MSCKVYYVTKNSRLCNQHNYEALLLLQLPYCVRMWLLISHWQMHHIQTLLLLGTSTKSFKKQIKTNLICHYKNDIILLTWDFCQIKLSLMHDIICWENNTLINCLGILYIANHSRWKSSADFAGQLANAKLSQ